MNVFLLLFYFDYSMFAKGKKGNNATPRVHHAKLMSRVTSIV